MFRRKVAPGIEIRQFEMRDVEPTFAAVERNREYLRQWLPWVDYTRTADDLRHFISRVQTQFDANQGPQAGIWVNGQFSGSLGCHAIDWANRNSSIGFWVDAAQQGQGLITRCCAVMLDYLFHEMALHRLVAAEQVLVDASPDVVESRHAVGGGGTLVEDPGLGTLALGQGAREDIVRLPAGQ